MRTKLLSTLKTYGVITLASALYAIGFVWCFDPNQIGFGGITGVAQIINSFFPQLTIGVLVILLNLPLFFLGWRLLGGHLLVSSLYAMAISSVFIDGFNYFFGPFQPFEPIMASLCGGALVGASLGLILAQGATTGGTDLIARLLKIKISWLPMGKLLMVIDLVVIVSVAAVFRSLDSALYGLLGILVSSTVVDKVLYGMDTAKVAYIISAKPDAIISAIVNDLDRGVTILNGRGGYSGENKDILMCAFKQRQIVSLKKAVKGIDPAAFLIVCDAHEVLGDGFRDYSQDDL